MYRLGYNTNGLAHHRVEDALRLLDELGYRAASITPDVGQLDLYRLDRAEVRRVRTLARELDLALAVETGARFLLDARVKHFPTLLEPAARERTRRIDFLRRSIDLAGQPLVGELQGELKGGLHGALQRLGPRPGDPGVLRPLQRLRDLLA